MNDYESLKNVIRKCVEDSLSGAPAIYGYALQTDDDLSTIFHVVLKNAPEDNDSRFGSYDWQDDLGASHFDSAQELLQHLSANTPDESAETYKHSAFFAMVEALSEVKALGLLPHTAFLVVSSTDPCDPTKKWCKESVHALNDNAMAEAWEAWSAQWE